MTFYHKAKLTPYDTFGYKVSKKDYPNPDNVKHRASADKYSFLMLCSMFPLYAGLCMRTQD